jgi:uncharacterized protein
MAQTLPETPSSSPSPTSPVLPDTGAGSWQPLNYVQNMAMRERARMFEAPAQSLVEMAPDGLPQSLKDRLPSAMEQARAHAATAAASQAKKFEQMKSRFKALQSSQRNTEHRLEELRELGDQYTRALAPVSACHAECSHCCHIPVTISAAEARMIGKAIGIRPVELEPGTIKEPGPSGYDQPCPFLKNNRCGIYAHRPMPCRWLFNLDADALLCELVEGMAVPVPYANLQHFHLLYTQISFGEALADLRDFFPPERLNRLKK